MSAVEIAPTEPPLAMNSTNHHHRGASTTIASAPSRTTITSQQQTASLEMDVKSQLDALLLMTLVQAPQGIPPLSSTSHLNPLPSATLTTPSSSSPLISSSTTTTTTNTITATTPLSPYGRYLTPADITSTQFQSFIAAALAAAQRRNSVTGAAPPALLSSTSMITPTTVATPTTPLLITTTAPKLEHSPTPSFGAPPSPPYEHHLQNYRRRKSTGSVTDGRSFACEYEGCNKTFMQLAHLKIHHRKHTGERPYVCKFEGCNKSFTQLGNLKTHERKHTGEKPFKCSFEGCDKAFSQMGNMKTHELLHYGIKPYTCDIDGCTRAFSQLGNLKSHQLKVHHNPSSRRGSRKRSITPSSEEEDPALFNAEYKKRRLSTVSAVSASSSGAEDGVVPADGLPPRAPRSSSSRPRQTQEEKLLAKMKAVLQRRSSCDPTRLQLGAIAEEQA
ncbi:hypothetical protein HDU85_001451 [Gaertneriomyces sp. JEL0708]|nr:hypothetical protein HDU85_001451 [Gaertneriomyces sp. JEL0708]